jgi:hypothetical protein
MLARPPRISIAGTVPLSTIQKEAHYRIIPIMPRIVAIIPPNRTPTQFTPLPYIILVSLVKAY